MTMGPLRHPIRAHADLVGMRSAPGTTTSPGASSFSAGSAGRRRSLPRARRCAARLPPAPVGPHRQPRNARPARLQLRRVRPGHAAGAGLRQRRPNHVPGRNELQGPGSATGREDEACAADEGENAAGGRGRRPGSPVRKSPSLSGYPGCDSEVSGIAAELWGAGTPAAGRRRWARACLFRNSVTIGRHLPTPRALPVLYGDFTQVELLLKTLGVEPDFESDRELRYTHRRDGASEIYFVSNPAGTPAEANCTFRVSGKTPELRDAVDGRRAGTAVAARAHGGRTRLTLNLGPHDSVFVVFQADAGAPAKEPILPPLTQAAGIDGPWDVQFQRGRGAPEQTVLHSLMDLSTHPDSGIRHFSGTAVYRATSRGESRARAASSTLGVSRWSHA